MRSAQDVGDQDLDLHDYHVAVLAAFAWYQPVIKDEPRDIFGKEIRRDLIGHLHARGLIWTGARFSRRGAPHTYVNAAHILEAFDLESLHDLANRVQLEEAGAIQIGA